MEGIQFCDSKIVGETTDKDAAADQVWSGKGNSSAHSSKFSLFRLN